MHSNTIICYYYLLCTRADLVPRFCLDAIMTLLSSFCVRRCFRIEKNAEEESGEEGVVKRHKKSKQKIIIKFVCFFFVCRIYSRHSVYTANGYAYVHTEDEDEEQCPFCDCVRVFVPAEPTDMCT